MAEITDWSTTAASNNSTAPDGWPPSTMTLGTIDNTGREMMAVLKRGWADSVEGDKDSTGSANAYLVAANRTVAAYYDGLRIGFHASFTNTAGATLNVDSVGAKDFVKRRNVALDPGDIRINQYVDAVYSATDDNFQIQNPHGNADPGLENLLDNGSFRVAQRGTSFTAASTPANSDDKYLIDRWILLSDGNDIVDVSQETSVVPTGSYSALKLDVETANKKAGVLQIVEARNAAQAIGGTVSLSFQAKKVSGNTTLDKLRAAVISWSSTADSPTSDVVSVWGAEGTDPTLVTNWTYENTPSDLTLTDSFQTFIIDGMSVDTASTTNIGVFIWIDNSDATATDLVYITDVVLVKSPTAVSVQERHYTDELDRCQRYYWRDGGYGFAGHALSTTVAVLNAIFPVQMRAAPTASLVQTTVSVNFQADKTSGGSSTISANTSTSGAKCNINDFTGLTAGEGGSLNDTGGAVLEFSAEL